jgi:NADH:ubiquinone oxidoreductase subunit F (NADH-binding)
MEEQSYTVLSNSYCSLSTATVVKALKDSTLEYRPGTGQHYAQADFMLLGYILEKIYKKPLRRVNPPQQDIINLLYLQKGDLGRGGAGFCR